MAIKVLANSAAIIRPPVSPPINITGDVELVVNTTRVGLPVVNEGTKADIELVQFYLSEFFDTMPGVLIPTDFPRSKKTGEMVSIDGILGPQTNAAIELFQQHLNQKKKVDKIISVPRAINTNKSRPEVSDFIKARSILVLALTWKTFHPNEDILNSSKILKAPHLIAELNTMP
jgi:hypothetical protein